MTLNGRILKADAVWLLRSVAATVAAIILIAFALSFNSQRELAIAAHIPELWAWGWPLIVDGTIVVATFAVLILKARGESNSWYPWAILIVFGALSIYANGVHATGAVPSIYEAFTIGAVPAVALLVSTHLLVMILAMPEEAEPGSAPQRQTVDDHTEAAGANEPTSVTPATSPLHGVELLAVHTAGATSAALPAAARPSPTPRPTSRKTASTTVAANAGGMSRDAAAAKALREFKRTGEWPTGAEVGTWMGKSAKSGQRVLTPLKEQHAQ